MTNKEVINSGNTQLYNQIYCNFTPANSLGYNTCNNCNFTDIKPFSSIKQTSENNCNTNCDNNPACVAYTYNTSSGICDNFNNFPNGINYNSPGNNSGYSVKGTYNFNSLNSQQQNNVKVKCADQFLNNTYIKNNNIEIANCLKINESGKNTVFNIDPTCLYNIYQQNKLPVNKFNQANYNIGNVNVNTITDPVIDKYMNEYNSFTVSNVQNININNKLNEFNPTPIIDNTGELYKQYKSTVGLSTIPLNFSLLPLNRSLGIDTKEGMEYFENENMDKVNKFKFIPILLIIFIIFIILFYVFKKK